MTTEKDTPPPLTTTVIHDIAGTCYLPRVFDDNLATIIASLDFARVWEGHENRVMVAQELRAAAEYARALARQADHYAEQAEKAAGPDKEGPR